MASVNKVILIGNLGKDPEVRYTPSGAAICNVTIATSRQWKDKTSGERQEETEWHRVVFYDRLAEIAGEYLKKGKSVYVEGRLKTRKWTDKEGVDKYTTEIIAQEMRCSAAAKAAAAAAATSMGAAPAPRSAPPARSAAAGAGAEAGRAARHRFRRHGRRHPVLARRPAGAGSPRPDPYRVLCGLGLIP